MLRLLASFCLWLYNRTWIEFTENIPKWQKDKNIFSSSDVTLENNFVDRNDENKTKTFYKGDIWSWTFAFQEAVDKLPTAVRVRMIVMIMMMQTMWRWGMILLSTSGFWCATTAGSADPPPPRSSASATPTGSSAASQSFLWTSVRWVVAWAHLHQWAHSVQGSGWKAASLPMNLATLLAGPHTTVRWDGQ